MFALLTIVMLAGLAGPLLGYGRRGLISVVVGELIGGAILGRTGFGVIDPTTQPLPAFSAIGFAMLMFSAGTHVDIRSPQIREGFVRGLSALAVVGVAAVPLGIAVDHVVGLSHPALLAVLIAGSSAAVAFPILEERGLAGPNISFLIAWIATADSVTVILMPLTLSGSGNIGLALGGDAALIAAAIVVIVAASRLRAIEPTEMLRKWSLSRGWAWQARLSMILVLGLSAIAERTGASTLVAGFLAGIVLTRLREPGRLAVQLSGIANGFFVPVFFVLLGAQLNLRALVADPSRIVLAFALAAAAVIAHVIAATLRGSEHRVATGLAASAQLGLPAAAASLGLGSHLLSASEAAALVAAGCLTLIPATIGSLLLARPPRGGTAAATPRAAAPVGVAAPTGTDEPDEE
ncbi:MAG: cation:proton antiporter [Candidatus Dormibacteraeota bacterium]|nr:cation:proton antiporter [Candidatus Dormibacteraeota bacterium]